MPATSNSPTREQRWAARALRWALALGFLSAVADRFGLWGPPGSPHVDWGDWMHFAAYAAKVNGFAPAVLRPFLAWAATGAEIVVGLGLLVGFKPRLFAYGAAVLLTLFVTAMTLSFGPKAPLDYSVITGAAASWLLATLSPR